MKERGGYFGLELNRGKEFHEDALRLNLGRTAFEYILRAKGVKKVFIPYYTCEVILEPLARTGVDFEYYHINENLEPDFNYVILKADEYFLYTNYFGIKDKFICTLKEKVCNLIIDNSQAFFSRPLKEADTFYSPRKFFGLPDGGYLYTDKLLSADPEADSSIGRFAHLIGRIEAGAEQYYDLFKENDHRLSGQPIKRMSNITHRLLLNINYAEAAGRRRRNFEYLSEKLGKINLIDFDFKNESAPMVYPLFTDNQKLRQNLINQKIFVATYWSEVKKLVRKDSIESRLVSGIIPLPVDQRYNMEDMDFIVKSVLQYV